MAVTMQDIAKRAGVSRPVVSAVLNESNQLQVAPTTRMRILDLASEMGYTRNLSARMLKGKTSHSVALFINPRFLLIYRDLQQQITLALRDAGYRALQFPLYEARTTAEIFQDSLQFGLDGIFSIDCPTTVRQAELQTPMVALMRNEVELDAGVDFEKGMHQITRHLLDHGHTRLCLIGASLHFQTAKVAGFRRACEEAGLPPEHTLQLDLTWNERFDTQLRELIEKKRVTAFIASSDYVAVRLMGYLHHHLQLRVPQDIAVTGFDGDMYAVSGPCRLTTIRQPMTELARLGVRLLLEKIRDQRCRPIDPPLLLEPTLHLGDSCGCCTPAEKTIVWEHVPTTLEGSAQFHRMPPPELFERYQNPSVLAPLAPLDKDLS